MTVSGEIRWDEGPLSVSNSASNGVINYIVTTDDSDNEDRGSALSWLATNSPDTLFGLIRDRVSVEELVYDQSHTTEKTMKWNGSVSYKNKGSKKPKDLKDPEGPGPVYDVRWHIRSGGGQSINMLYSQQMIGEIFSAPEYNWGSADVEGAERLLNVQTDTSEDSSTMFVAKGIDMPTGVVEVVVETIQPASEISAGFLVNASYYASEQSVNLNPWRGFPAGSLKASSFDASQRSGDEADSDTSIEAWEINYTFLFQPFRTAAELNQKLPPGLESKAWTVDKKGWHILDYMYVDNPIGDTVKFVIPTAVRGAVQKVYREEDYATVFRI